MRTVTLTLLTALGAFAVQPALTAEKAGNWMRVTLTQIVDPNHALQSLDGIALAKLLKSTGISTRNYCALEGAPPPATFQLSPTVSCTMNDPQLEGATFHAEFFCHGTTHGSGKMTITYDSAEHYNGESLYSPSEMMSLKWKSTFEGKWTGPTCAAP